VAEADADRYRLSTTENELIFRTEIVPEELAHAAPQELPTVVFLIAQQGGGKTREAQRIGGSLNRHGGYAEIDSDVYKTYHLDYDRLLAEDDRLMAAYTGPDGQRWHNQAQEYAREHRLNVLIQETAQNPPYLAAVAADYRDAGYRVEMAFLGVPEAMSRQGILQRYHDQVQDRGHGRLTVPAKRDASYRGILNTADLIDTQRLAHTVTVSRRGEGAPRYENHLTSSGEWQQPPRLREAIETERNRPWTEQETSNFLQVHRRLIGEMGPDFQPELTTIRKLAEPLMAPGTAGPSDTLRRLRDLSFPQTVRDALSQGQAPPQPNQGQPGPRHRLSSQQNPDLDR
jgi:hypothetical protein